MEVRSDYVHFAQMASTSTVLADTHLRIMVSEVDVEQLAFCPFKVFTVDETHLFPRCCNIACHWPLEILDHNLFGCSVDVSLDALRLEEVLSIRHGFIQPVFIVQNWVCEWTLSFLKERALSIFKSFVGGAEMSLVREHVSRLWKWRVVSGLKMGGGPVSSRHAANIIIAVYFMNITNKA